MKFRDLAIGDTFDFVGPDRIYNSFYEICEKISARQYRYTSTQFKTVCVSRVGSINCEVYNVVKTNKEAL